MPDFPKYDGKFDLFFKTPIVSQKFPIPFQKFLSLARKLSSFFFAVCGLYVVGSSLNGFGTNSSDMDLCLIITNKDVSREKF